MSLNIAGKKIMNAEQGIMNDEVKPPDILCPSGQAGMFLVQYPIFISIAHLNQVHVL